MTKSQCFTAGGIFFEVIQRLKGSNVLMFRCSEVKCSKVKMFRAGQASSAALPARPGRQTLYHHLPRNIFIIIFVLIIIAISQVPQSTCFWLPHWSVISIVLTVCMTRPLIIIIVAVSMVIDCDIVSKASLLL